MREIKFRAWNVVTKTMIDLKKITPLALNMDTDGLFLPFSDGLPLMQFSGLKDVNERDVYEGDILEYVCYPTLGKNALRAPVCFHEGKGAWATEYKDGEFHYFGSEIFKVAMKVIGNIYEHPHLLNQQP